jgi:antitoxin HigA-1
MKPYARRVNKLALELRVPVTRIADIVAKRRGITSDTARRLARYFKTTPQFWLNLQTKYDLESIAEDKLAQMERDVRPLESAARKKEKSAGPETRRTAEVRRGGHHAGKMPRYRNEPANAGLLLKALL